MRLLHISDLHLGKRVGEFSMIEDQRHIINCIFDIIDKCLPQAVLIAGDVYDKSVPSAESVELFDDLLFGLSSRGVSTFVISGNHDSAERIAFGGRLMDKSGIYMSPVYNGEVSPVTLTDEYGEVFVYMLPFVKPSNVRRFFEDADIQSYTDALGTAVDAMNIDRSRRNILITHQFVTGALRTESEDISVGGTDNVDVSVFDGFDYVALGHIHRAQACSFGHIRYSGTPLKYSFSEANDVKSVTLVDIGKKGDVRIELCPLTPLRDMSEIRGTYEQLTLKSFYDNTSYTDDYMHITLTDEEDVPDALARLRTIYKNVMKLDYDNTRTRSMGRISGADNVKQRSPLDVFCEFYQEINGKPMGEEQSEFIKNVITEIWEEN